MPCVDSVHYNEIYDDYEHDLRDFADRVYMLYRDSIQGVYAPENEGVSEDEIVIKRRLKKSFCNRIKEFIRHHGDITKACLDCLVAFEDAQTIPGRDRVLLTLSGRGRSWLRERREELESFLEGSNPERLSKLLGRD